MYVLETWDVRPVLLQDGGGVVRPFALADGYKARSFSGKVNAAYPAEQA